MRGIGKLSNLFFQERFFCNKKPPLDLFMDKGFGGDFLIVDC
jgi:hypothetical protein